MMIPATFSVTALAFWFVMRDEFPARLRPWIAAVYAVGSLVGLWFILMDLMTW
ncbi:hypothetical protein [Agrobacterium tumefaciens]|uniref:hypothetical protein n=1 Tax=Agrobacterium tumefaciens TaxID=358 RepID=UPI0013866807|nr:hypothetical protein [Agrobacterium tumefaciens]